MPVAQGETPIKPISKPRSEVRVCHVNLARGFRGGERQTELLIRGLAAQAGISQRFVGRRNEPLLEKLADVDGLELVSIAKPFWLKKSQLVGDVVHAHENKAAHLAAGARKAGGPPYLITRRVDNPPGTNRLTRQMYRNASAVVAISTAIAKILRAYEAGLTPELIPSSLGRLEQKAEAVAALKARWAGKIVIGHVGELDNSQKGQVHLIRAMKAVIQVVPNAHCVLLGSGKDEAWLRQEAEGMDCIEFAGYMPNVGDYLAAFDVFAFPSLHEGLGSSLLDAMYFALPIVASEVDGIPDIVKNDINGLLVPAADENALAERLQLLLKDAQLQRRLGDKGKQMSTDYVPEVMAEKYQHLYQRVIQASSTA